MPSVDRQGSRAVMEVGTCRELALIAPKRDSSPLEANGCAFPSIPSSSEGDDIPQRLPLLNRSQHSASSTRRRAPIPGGQTSNPAAFRWALAVSRRTSVSYSMRRRVHPSRPSASICCCLSRAKTLAMPEESNDLIGYSGKSKTNSSPARSSQPLTPSISNRRQRSCCFASILNSRWPRVRTASYAGWKEKIPNQLLVMTINAWGKRFGLSTKSFNSRFRVQTFFT